MHYVTGCFSPYSIAQAAAACADAAAAAAVAMLLNCSVWGNAAPGAAAAGAAQGPGRVAAAAVQLPWVLGCYSSWVKHRARCDAAAATAAERVAVLWLCAHRSLV